MLFKNISILDENFEVRQNMYVGVDAGIIEYIGTEAPEKDYGRNVRRQRQTAYERILQFARTFTDVTHARLRREYGLAGLAE